MVSGGSTATDRPLPRSGFTAKLAAAVRRNDSLLCLGLDPDPAKLPEAVGGDAALFHRELIAATADLVCAYKPNLAFYEALGRGGYDLLERTLALLPNDIVTIGDAKRNDIGYSATGYARSLFEQWGFDSITVNPYLGMETLEPFAGYSDRGVFVLCRTSNPGSGDFQSLRVESGELLYEVVARRTVESNQTGGFGLVVGATYPAELVRVRAIAPELPILIPGVGAQAGDLEAAVRGGCDASGAGAIVNVGRQIVLASSGADFAAAARRVATQIRAEINRYRPPAPTS